jgi:hypothetical protein
MSDDNLDRALAALARRDPSNPRLTAAPGGEAVAWISGRALTDLESGAEKVVWAYRSNNDLRNPIPLYRHPEAGEREGVPDLSDLRTIVRAAMHEVEAVSVLIEQGKRVPREMTEALRNYIRQCDNALRALASSSGEKEPGK